jgi:hypothetical protein
MEPQIYRIRLEGRLAPPWQEWFEGRTRAWHDDETVLSGPVRDQTALQGLRARVRDLDRPRIAVERDPTEGHALDRLPQTG